MDRETTFNDTGTVPETRESRRPRSAAERMMLAGIGAVASALDTAESGFERYVDRGEQVREELRERSDDVRRQNWRARNRARDYFRGAMDIVLDTFNVPSRTDVDTINVKLNILTRKLDDLQMQSAERAAPPTPASPPPVTGEPPISENPAT